MAATILVALDHSPISSQVFQEALTLAKALHTEIVLLHVLSRGAADSPNLPAMPIMDYYPDYNTSAMELFEQAWQAYEKKGMTMLNQYETVAKADGVQSQALQIEGAPGLVICEQAQNLDASMIVMGRRGHTGFSELLLGSVSNYVLHHAPCTVHILNALRSDDAAR
ncbi:MAG: universal stress protein [Cyanobacteria bacterium P01_F01_bin.42]